MKNFNFYLIATLLLNTTVMASEFRGQDDGLGSSFKSNRQVTATERMSPATKLTSRQNGKNITVKLKDSPTVTKLVSRQNGKKITIKLKDLPTVTELISPSSGKQITVEPRNPLSESFNTTNTCSAQSNSSNIASLCTEQSVTDNGQLSRNSAFNNLSSWNDLLNEIEDSHTRFDIHEMLDAFKLSLFNHRRDDYDVYMNQFKITSNTQTKIWDDLMASNNNDQTLESQTFARFTALTDHKIVYADSINKAIGKTQYYFGLIYFDGLHDKKNNKIAFDWFAKAADKGYVQAYFCLAQMYKNSYGCSDNENENSKYWYNKSEHNGHYYKSDFSREKLNLDFIKSRLSKVYNKVYKAALYGRSDALLLIARMQQIFDPISINSVNKSYYYVSRELKNTDQEILFYKGWLNFYKLQKTSEAFDCWKISAGCDERGYHDAQYHLGMIHMECGNISEAVKWFNYSYNQHNEFAGLQLANIHTKGLGIYYDVQKAAKCFSYALIQNNKIGLFADMTGMKNNYLGNDINKLIEELTNASDSNNSSASFALANLYLFGKDIASQNGDLVVRYCKLAYNQGYMITDEDFAFIKEKLKSAQS